jgi:hypothetical protein
VSLLLLLLDGVLTCLFLWGSAAWQQRGFAQHAVICMQH